MLRPPRSIGCPWQEKLLTIPRLTAHWNLDLSRAREINPGDACGDDDKASPNSGFRPTPPSAMMLIHPSGPACVQKNTFFNARRHHDPCSCTTRNQRAWQLGASHTQFACEWVLDSMSARLFTENLRASGEALPKAFFLRWAGASPIPRRQGEVAVEPLPRLAPPLEPHKRGCESVHPVTKLEFLDVNH
jgi:hypothetical protein